MLARCIVVVDGVAIPSSKPCCIYSAYGFYSDILSSCKGNIPTDPHAVAYIGPSELGLNMHMTFFAMPLHPCAVADCPLG